jgi:hypothetical protein
VKTETEKPQLLVVSIPAGLDADAIQRLMNEPLQDGDYYFGALVPHGPGLFALFRLRAEKERVDKAAPDEERALAILKASPQLSADKLIASLAARGIKRGRQWVYTRRAEMDLLA